MAWIEEDSVQTQNEDVYADLTPLRHFLLLDEREWWKHDTADMRNSS